MLKINQPSAPVINVTAGQNATLDLNPGPRYHAVLLIATVTKTSPTADAVISPTLGDVLGLINIKVNTVAKRQHTAVELDAVQTRWSSYLAATKFDGLSNDLITAVADTTATNNSVGCTTRTTTWVLVVNFAEPSRESYTARQAFAWPTSWANGQRAKIQFEIGVPNNTNITLATMATGKAFFTNPVIRAEEVIDYVTGPVDSTGKAIMPITHWFRQPESYGGTNPVIRKFPFTGILQQSTIFSPASTDYVTGYEIKLNNSPQAKGTLASRGVLNGDYAWNNTAQMSVATNGTVTASTQFDLAFDFDDDASPTNSLPVGGNDILEYNLTLAAASATNKTLTILSQVYRDALAA